jgi:ABC-type multidrug transport system permease subunit
VAFCVVSCGESSGILFLTVFSHTGLAVSMMTVIMAVSVSLTGILRISMDRVLTAVSYISPAKWHVGALLSYTLRDIEFTCTDEQNWTMALVRYSQASRCSSCMTWM